MSFWRNNRAVRRLLLGVAVLAAAVWAAQLWWHWMYPVAQFRYKLTVEVMTPDGLKSGSSVIEVSYQNAYSLSGVPNLRLTARGEAVFLPMGGDKFLAVTLTNWLSGRSAPQIKSLDLESGNLQGALDVHALPLKTFGLSWINYDENLLMSKVETLSRQKQRMPASFANLPTLVVFEDINNPESLKVVQPGDLAAVLGDGYKLENVWLEFTEDQPTNTGMKLLPWWNAKSKEQRTLGALGQGQTVINNIFDSAFRRPGIWGNNK